MHGYYVRNAHQLSSREFAHIGSQKYVREVDLEI
jgi:hypothetical protein